MKILTTRQYPKIMIYIQIAYVLVMSFFTDVLRFPNMITYVTDLINMSILVFLLINWKKMQETIKKSCFTVEAILVSFYFALACFTAFFNGVKPTLFIWDMRNSFRFFVFLFACIAFLDQKDVDRIYGLLLGAHILNIAACLYEYFVLHLVRDNVGGIFGSELGCNNKLNVFLCVVMVYSTCLFIYKKISLKILLFYLISSILIAAVAELKVFYLELAIVLFLAVCLNLSKVRMVGFGMIGIFVLLVGLNAIKRLFPLHYEYLTNFRLMLQYVSSEDNFGYYISRTHPFSQIDRIFFHGNILRNMFGYGFGNCVFSSRFDQLTSSFYKLYGHLNYPVLTSAFVFLETGYIGTMLHLAILIYPVFYAFRSTCRYKRLRFHRDVTAFLGIIFLVIYFDCQALGWECAYLIYFCIASIVIKRKSIQKK